MRSQVSTLGNDATKESLDEKKSSLHYRVFQSVELIYNDRDNADLQSIHWKDNDFFMIHEVDKTCFSTFDPYSADECTEVFDYIQAWYKHATNNRAKSS